MPGEFNGKVVLITGAASGLGRAASIRFAQDGASLCLVDINADGLSDTVQRIGEMEGGCTPFSADLGTQATCAQADRKRVVWGQSLSVRVYLCGRRIINNKQH